MMAPRKAGRPPVLGLKMRRREEILAAATGVFAERGYLGTDVQFVADKLGVGKGTVYRYFPAKSGLFLAAVDRGMKILQAGVAADGAGIADPLHRIEKAIDSYLRFFRENPHFVELLVQERAQFRDRRKPTYFQHRDANIGPWRALFQGLMDRGRVRRMPVNRITGVMSDLLYGTMFTDYFLGGRTSTRVDAGDIVDIVFHGILKPER